MWQQTENDEEIQCHAVVPFSRAVDRSIERTAVAEANLTRVLDTLSAEMEAESARIVTDIDELRNRTDAAKAETAADVKDRNAAVQRAVDELRNATLEELPNTLSEKFERDLASAFADAINRTVTKGPKYPNFFFGTVSVCTS